MAQPLKYKLTEEDLKKMTNSILFHLKETFDNPLTMPEEIKNSPLMEGYFKTYPPEKVEKYLKERYGKYAYVDRYENDNGVEVFRIGIYNDEDGIKVVDKDMSLCGYFPSMKEIKGEMIYMFYEPRHQNKVNELVNDEEYIYHLTPSNKVGKILQNGLCPKTNNKKFNYPGRIYFFLHEPEKDDCLLLMKQFYLEDVKNQNKVAYKGPYTLLRIDTEQIKGVNFSYDPNAYECIYTYDNISPEAIEVVCEFKQEYIK